MTYENKPNPIRTYTSSRQLPYDLFPFYLIGILILFGVKYFYSKADSDDLLWILTPTTRWVSILSGISFVYEPGTGYVNHSLRYLIAPSCSGVQFLMISFATLLFSFIHRMSISGTNKKENRQESRRKSIAWLIGSIAASYLLTIFVNGLRIIIAIYLPLSLEGTAAYESMLTPERLHTIIGTTVYFVSLIVIYRIGDWLSHMISPSHSHQNNSRALPQLLHTCLPPVFWYFFIVLGLPFLNRANKKGHEQFTEYSMLITFVCVIVLILYCLTFAFRKLWKHYFASAD